MVEIKDLTKRYGKDAVVNGVSLSVRPNTVFGFLGQNGAGKTTTMKIIVGLSNADAGSVEIDGKPSHTLEAREHIGYMPEAPYFYDRLTGLEFLRFCGSLFYKTHDRSDTYYESILEKTGIHHARNRPIRTYSKGMKQRLGFAQALVNDPKYIFLDEPLDGLDPVGRKEIKKIITSLKDEGKTIFFNSHILFDVEELCDEIGIIHGGELLYAGPVVDFCGGKRLEDRFVEEVTRTRPLTH